MTKAVTYVELDIPYCSLTYGVLPCTAGTEFVSRFDGFAFGTLTAGGGINAPFDGESNKTLGESANLQNTPLDGTVAKYWGDGVSRIIRNVTVIGPSNIAIVRNSSNTNTSATIRLGGSNDGTSWTTLDTTTTGTSLSASITLTSASNTPYNYHRIIITPPDSSSDMAVARLIITELVTSDKCFNTKATCQAPLAYTETTETLRFAIGADYLSRDITCIPCILKDGIDFTPGRLALGDGLGERSVLKVVMKDGKHSDTGPGFDKYYTERDYDPYEQGTVFGKLRARQKYLRGAAMRWYQGNSDQALSEMEMRAYFVDSLDGPNEDGLFTIIAKDPLKFLDGDRTQAPTLSSGFLSAAITDTATSATLLPVGIGNAEYEASGFVCIGGNEVCSFTRSGDVLTLTRHALGTTASAHNAEDRVQTVLRYAGNSPATIIWSLETVHSGIPSFFVNLTEWQAEIDAFSGQVYTLVVTEPTPIKQLVEEVMESAGLAHWWDDVNQQLRLMVIREISTSPDIITSAKRRAGSLEIIDQPEKRISRVQVYYGQIDPTKGASDPDNFRASIEVVNDVAEEAYGNVVIKTIYSRCIPALGGAIATQLGNILVSRYVDPPRRITYEIQRTDDVAIPVLAGGYQVASKFLQNEKGEEINVPVQVTKLQPGAAVIQVEAEEMSFAEPITVDPTDHTVIVAVSINNFNLRTKHDQTFPDAVSGDTVTAIINSGVIVGSTSRSTPAFTVGSWPAGVTVNVVVNGRIQGCAGDGGRGGYYFDDGPSAAETVVPIAGTSGGTALKTGRAIGLSGSGKVWGGAGGGGGGAAYIAPVGFESTGGGGGGGQGQKPGKGGVKRADGNAGTAGTTEAPGRGGAGTRTGKGGGDGGAEGQAGQAGRDADFPTQPYQFGAAGGAAGNAIDGDSFVTETGTLDVQGPRIN